MINKNQSIVTEDNQHFSPIQFAQFYATVGEKLIHVNGHYWPLSGGEAKGAFSIEQPNNDNRFILVFWPEDKNVSAEDLYVYSDDDNKIISECFKMAQDKGYAINGYKNEFKQNWYFVESWEETFKGDIKAKHIVFERSDGIRFGVDELRNGMAGFSIMSEEFTIEEFDKLNETLKYITNNAKQAVILNQQNATDEMKEITKK